MIKVAMIGLGYWGPNLLRNLVGIPDIQVSAICDLDKRMAEANRKKFCPQALVTSDYHDLGNHSQVDAVVIATPLKTHFEIGSYFLKSGKHIFIEKPLAHSVVECQQLIDLAEKRRCVLMVGHVFEYNNAVRKIKQYLAEDELGRTFYIYSQRVNLGRVQNDISALWSFAPHDVSIINYWLDQEPCQVSARGFSLLNSGIEDVVFVTLEYPNGIGAHLHLGWLDPRKIRLMTIVGSKKMLVYDDVSTDAKLQIYDKGIVDLHNFIETPFSYAEFQFQIRSGDLVIPALKFDEPLQSECLHFVDSIRTGRTPLTDGMNGLRVVKVLEAADRSLKQKGASIPIV